MKVKFVILILLSLVNISIATETDLEWRGSIVRLSETEENTVMSLNDVKKECETQGAYLCLDVDETIYHAEDTIRTHAEDWCGECRARLARAARKPTKGVTGAIDGRITSFVKAMLKLGNVLILTARPLSPARELKEMDLIFSEDKIIVTGGGDKGVALMNYFVEKKRRPAKIVFMDDQIERLQEVARACKRVKIDYIGYECTYSITKICEELLYNGGLTKDEGFWQVEYYEKNHIWLHDFDVKIHLYARQLWAEGHEWSPEIPAELDKLINYVCCNSYSHKTANLFEYIKGLIEDIITKWEGDEKSPADSCAAHESDENNFLDVDSEDGDKFVQRGILPIKKGNF